MNTLRYTLGLNLGIASVGWAVLQNDANKEPMKIVDLGVRVFERAEQPKTGKSLAAPRREARSARRRLRRRRHRKERIKYLIETEGIMTKAEMEAMFAASGFEKSVYELRVYGLDNRLNREELVRLLIHYAQRRGYRSNSTAEAAKDDKEAGKVKKALSDNRERMQRGGYRTVGEMIWKDPDFRDPETGELRPHNAPNDYKLTQERSEIVREVRMILSAQMVHGSTYVHEAFIEKYLSILESQRNFDEGPGGNSPFGGNLIEKMFGPCTFLGFEGEKRAAKACYTFEYFRLLQELNHMRLVRPGHPSEPLTKEQREIIIAAAMKTEGLTYAQIRKKLGIPDEYLFNSLYYGSKEVAEQEKKKFGHMQSYHKIRKALNSVEKGLINKISTDDLDVIGHILTAYKNDDNRTAALSEAGISERIIPALLELSFSKTGNLSVKAMRMLIPELEKGITYDKACIAVFGSTYKDKNVEATEEDKKKRLAEEVENITNPVVRRSVAQTMKVIRAIIRKYGPPEQIRIELAREMKKNHDERKKLKARQVENQKANERICEKVREYKNGEPTGLDIVKFKLWEEQDGKCLYSGKPLALEHLFDAGYADVGHIIPYSLSFDDSYNNKETLL